MPMSEVVLVLHADDVRDGASLGDLLGCHVAEPDVPNEPLTLQVSQHLDLLLDRSLSRPVHPEHDAKVDNLERIEPQVAQVVVYGAGQFRGRVRRVPRTVGSTLRANLRHERQVRADTGAAPRG